MDHTDEDPTTSIGFMGGGKKQAQAT